MCGVFFGYWGLVGEGRGEISFVSIVDTMTWGYYKWIIILHFATCTKKTNDNPFVIAPDHY